MFTSDHNFSSLLFVVNEEPTKGSTKVECLNPTTKLKMNYSENIICRVTPEVKSELAILAKTADVSLSRYLKRIIDAHIASVSAPAPAHVVTFKSKAKAKAKAKPKAKAKAKPKAKAKK